MIKDDMTLPLGTDTTNIKATTAVFLSATDEQVSPYTIGFVPWDLMSKCVLFGKCSSIFLNSTPDTFFSSYVNPDSYYFNPDKGVPFVYTIRTQYGNKIMHANYASNSWHSDQMVGEGSNTDLQILHAYNTDYFVQNNVDQNESLTRVEFDIKIYEVIGNGGWTGTALQSVYEHNYLHVNATIADIENISITFSSTLASHFGTYTYTITQDNWLNCDEHGIFVLEGEDYEYQGQTYKRRLYCACVHASLPSESTITNASPGYGVLLAHGYRSTPHVGGASWACGWGRCEYGQTANRGYTINPYDYQRQFPSPYGYDSFVSDDVFFFRQATIQWYNHLLHGGATYEDVVVMICTSRPVYKNNNAYYVAEFTDDYYITGKLIPYAQARDWQKNINGDTNVFDPADIPEPGPEPPGEIDASSTGATIIPHTSFSIPCAGGFITQYALTGAQVAAFGHQLWASFMDPDFLESVFTTIVNDLSVTPSDILKYIVSLRAFPFSLADMPSYDPHDNSYIYFGRGIVPINLSTGIVGTINSYNEGLEAGFIEIPRTFNDFRDFEPYSSVHVYVPFCGAVELTPSEVVGHQLFLYYSIDMSTGACQVTIEVASEAPHPVAVLTGNIGATVQMSASNMMEVFQKMGNTLANMAGKIVGDIATAVSMQAGYEAQVADGASVPELRKTVASNFASAAKSESGVDSISGLTAGASSSVKGVSTGFSSMQQTDPYAIVQTRHYQVPENYGHVYGYPCNYKLKLESAEGFTVCKNVDLEGVPATQDELTLIEQLLQSGVYF